MQASFRRMMFGAALVVGASSVGCQTYEVGQTLPSPGFMRDDVQYFPKGPDFRLTNELNAQSTAEAERQANGSR